jgi:hypothetical protein
MLCNIILYEGYRWNSKHDIRNNINMITFKSSGRNTQKFEGNRGFGIPNYQSRAVGIALAFFEVVM